MRMLVIDNEARKKVDEVLMHALDPHNWYRPGENGVVPGDDPRFVAQLDTYRCVFTITERGPCNAIRHLSISVPSDKYPNIIAAFTIAQLFGFTGWDGKSPELPDSWMAHANTDEHCVVLGQPYLEAGAQA